MLAFHLLVGAFAVLMLVRHGPAALLFVAPGLRRPHAGPAGPARSPAEQRIRDALAGLGFRPIGTLTERGPLGALAREWVVLGGEGCSAWADVAEGRGGGWVRFVSASPDGAALETELPDATPEGALAAHRKGLEAFERAHGRSAAPPDLAARLEAARAHARGPARGKVRQASAMSFVNATLALVLVASSVNGIASALGSRGEAP
ncbi:MAG TPA: hypothetical protein VLS93_14810 [Anaeromyxobacteraceae bacterium]|nr:hypothetical protein [Anaeromyxobacteraceae bacterium]